MEKVSIRILPHPDYPQLAMKYVGANEYLTPKSGPDGKIITGLDENSLEINQIEDKSERDKLKKEIKKEREDLQRLLNQDLDTNSAFWDEFFVILSDELELDPVNPKHRLIERFLVANAFVAPSREAIELDEKYHNCVFFMFRDEVETSKKAQKELALDKAVSTLFILNEQNPHKLKVLVSYIFGFNAEADLTLEKAYVKLKDFIGATDIKDANAKQRTQAKNVETFLAAAGKSNEALTTKVLLDKAIKKRLVTTRNGIHRRGEDILGNSYDEAIEYLSSPENSAELISLKKEVERA